MPVTMGGVASGMDTDGIIQKLVEVEARPLQKLEQDKVTYNQRKEALRKLSQVLTELQAAAKELYGFRAVYDEKKVNSSNPAVVEGIASKEAEKGVRRIQVLELASTHKISTDTRKKDEKLPAGQFKIEVNGESRTIRFRGGTLAALEEAIKNEASTIVVVGEVNTSEDSFILTIESKVSGKRGELKITGDKEFLKAIGLIKGEKGAENESVELVFDSKFFANYVGEKKPAEQDGAISLNKDGRSVSIKGTLWREYQLPVEIPATGETVLSFDVQYTEPPEIKEEEALPFKVEIGPEENVAIKGIELQGYNVSRVRPVDKKKKKTIDNDVMGVGVISLDNNQRVEKIYPINKTVKGKYEVPLGVDFKDKKIARVVFYCNSGEVRFSEARITTPLKGLGLLDPKNVIASPSDARIKVDGIEITRPMNDGIRDVIKGVTISLHSVYKEDVTLTIECDIKKAVEKIKHFVEVYNQYIDISSQLTKADRTSKPGDYNKSRNKNGIFVGDMTINRLSNTIKGAVSNAYPTRADIPIKMLPQVGISTGEVNASWDSIKDGRLVVNETVLSDAILTNPEGVREFFGSDMDGDNRIDNGFGYNMDTILQPYVQPGKNIISSKIEMEDINIREADSRIEREREHLKSYEEKLRKKFATMERSMSGAKAQKQWMNQQSGNKSNEE